MRLIFLTNLDPFIGFSNGFSCASLHRLWVTIPPPPPPPKVFQTLTTIIPQRRCLVNMPDPLYISPDSSDLDLTWHEDL